jgi:hypothetical protein
VIRKDPFVALVLEIAGGFFGLPGIGWVYAGQTLWGLVFMIGYWLFDWALGLVLAILTAGLWCTVWPAQNLIVGAISGYLVYRWLGRNRANA